MGAQTSEVQQVEGCVVGHLVRDIGVPTWTYWVLGGLNPAAIINKSCRRRPAKSF
jgi:hypothetical protein